MRKYLPFWFAFAAIIIITGSCKLDKPILPGDKGYVAAVPPGGGTGPGTGTSVDTSLLSGTWTVKSTQIGDLVDGSLTGNVTSPENLFTDVVMDSSAKTGLFDGSFIITTGDPLTYTITKTGNNFYLDFSADPIGRTSNGPIQITALTSSSMTWLAPDPLIVSTQGHQVQGVYTIKFTR